MSIRRASAPKHPTTAAPKHPTTAGAEAPYGGSTEAPCTGRRRSTLRRQRRSTLHRQAPKHPTAATPKHPTTAAPNHPAPAGAEAPYDHAARHRGADEAYSYGASGDRTRALEEMEDLKKRSLRGEVLPFNLAVVHVGLGNRQAAIDYLE